MGGELAEAAALHARLMFEQQVTDLYTGDCMGCGKTFVPPAESRLARGRRCAVTCPECAARGRKHQVKS